MARVKEGDVFKNIKDAIEAKRPVTLLDHEAPVLQRVVCPHILYEMESGEVLVHFLQLWGFSSTGLKEGVDNWRNLHVANIAKVEDALASASWITPDSYNPDNRKQFFKILFKVKKRRK